MNKFVIALCLLFLSIPLFVQAQNRQHLTEAELEIVRDAQELDARTGVFIKAIDRRFAALNKLAETKDKKDKSDWGALPTGSRTELIWDIAKILDEAMNNLDSVYGRDEKNALIPKSLKMLSEAAARYQTQLKPFGETVAIKDERDAVYQAARNAEKIVQAQKDFAAQ
jgi:hypothetical protein